MAYPRSMDLPLIVLLFRLFTVSVLAGQDVRMPPTIVEGPDKDSHNFRDNDDYELKCLAEGIPKPEYEWLKNGEALTAFNSRITHQENTGTIRVHQLGTLDEGSYQCRAFNQYGTALTRTIVLRKAVLASYQSSATFDPPEVPEGTPYTLPCIPTKWYPKPIFSWALNQIKEGGVDVPIFPDQRIQIDDDGNLHFSYLLHSDMQNGMLYKCRLFNNVMDVTVGGSYARLRVTPVQVIQPFPPKKMFSTKSPLVGLEGGQITMKCFFSGKPDPMISWGKGGGASLPMGRYFLTNRQSEMTIQNLRPSDAGKYRCNAQNLLDQNVTEIIDVIVDAVPDFQNTENRPHNVNVTEGLSVVFKCKAYARPTASVEWFRNGVKLDPENLPRKFRLSTDHEELTISDLCKNCKDGETDLMVIQCNASNIHGYTFADGYINVIEKTAITVQPENISMALEDEYGELFIDAKTDDLTALAITWYKINHNEERRKLVADEPYVKFSEDSRRVSFYLPHNSAKRAEYNGVFEAVANNSYSAEIAVASIVTEFIIPPSPSPEPALAGLAELWWIIVLVAGLFLLFLLILICCICCYRNRGDVYPVDKKERKNGNDPEKELADSGFFDYKRPEIQPVKGSRVSLDSSISVSEEEASLNEYGDVDAGKFTEEGSFIGDYVPPAKSKVKHNKL